MDFNSFRDNFKEGIVDKGVVEESCKVINKDSFIIIEEENLEKGLGGNFVDEDIIQED